MDSQGRARSARRRRDVRQRITRFRALNERDLKILRAVFEFRVISQSQVRRLFFSENKSATVSTRVLAGLFDAAYVDRRILPLGGGRGENYYLLDRKGAEALRRELGYSWVKFHPSYKYLSDGAVRHHLAVGEFRILITQACERLGLKLEWIPEVTMRTPSGYDKVTLNGEPVGLIPDGVFCVTNAEGRRSLFALELDRGTMQPNKFRDKLRHYLQYMQEESYFQRFERWLTPNQLQKRQATMRMLTVVSTDSRTINGGIKRLEVLMKEADRAKLGSYNPQRRFWFARLADLSVENVLTQPVWRIYGDEKRNVLLWDFDPQNSHQVIAQ